jgi:SAM-dependent methyltransferase
MEAGSNREWERWGEIDPLFGVGSWEGKEVGGPNPWTDEEFYGLGQRDWADFRTRWERYGLTKGVCVEIGCGAGRMTRAMAADFEHVHGIDVSQGMLDRAAKAVEGLPVTLHLANGLRLPLDDAAADAAFSTHVFQHFDTMEDARSNWAELARVLRPGGTTLVHLPVHLWPGGFERVQSAYNLRRRLGDYRANLQRRRMSKGGAPIMRGLWYEWYALEAMLADLGFVDMELLLFRVSTNNSTHQSVLARKGPALPR